MWRRLYPSARPRHGIVSERNENLFKGAVKAHLNGICAKQHVIGADGAAPLLGRLQNPVSYDRLNPYTHKLVGGAARHRRDTSAGMR
jgi:hypothetical protein